ncbi:MAG: sugar phosphate isomerase/epimerase, partial [Cucumibacter sp.]
MPTAHIGLAQLEDVAAAAKICATLGIKVIYCPAPPADQRSGGDAEWKAFGAKLAKLVDSYARHGVGFGWHNHDFEFKATASGAMPLDLILGGSPSLQWEADVAWIKIAGQDPLRWIEKFADRLTAVHVKDVAPAGEAKDEDGWADVGHGTLNWAALMKTLTTKTKCKYFVMEHDNPSDPRRFAERSLKSLRAMGY